MAAAEPRRGRRWGLRARLLLLLIPGIALTLAFDSWSDHRARVSAISEALDEVLLQPLAVLDASVRLDAGGAPMLDVPLEAYAAFEALPARRKLFYAAAWPAAEGGAVSAAEPATLLGHKPLPAPPPGLAPTTSAPNMLTTPEAQLYLYDARFNGLPLRIACLDRIAHDAQGRPRRLRLQVAESTAQRDEVRRESLLRELWQDARTLLVTALLLLAGLSWTLAPLARLRDRVRARPSGEPAPLDPAEVPSEVLPLVEAANVSIERYRAVLAEQERFLADAAHQLRTPLAVMMAQVGYAQRAPEPGAAREALEGIARQLQRSRRLADQLLALSHAVSAARAAPPLVDLDALAREAVLEALPMARALGVDLGWSGTAAEDGATATLPVCAESQEILEILANLIHNALRHTPRGGSVTVAALRDGAQACVDVIDGGPGIAPAQREAVFERFGARSRGEGAGLGLAIARAYARRQGGEVGLHDAPAGTGLRARLTLPTT